MMNTQKQRTIAVILVIVVMAVAGCGDSSKPSDSNPKKVTDSEKDKKDTDSPKNNSSSKNNKDTDSSKDNNSSISNDEENKIFSVGDIVETSDLKISFISAKKYKSNNEFIQPKKGYVYYKMEFEFENISDSDKYVSSTSFNCYADGYDMEQQYFDGLDLNATLSKGKKTKGSVLFEIPKDAKEITLEYECNFWTENKIIFKVK